MDIHQPLTLATICKYKIVCVVVDKQIADGTRLRDVNKDVLMDFPLPNRLIAKLMEAIDNYANFRLLYWRCGEYALVCECPACVCMEKDDKGKTFTLCRWYPC